MKKTSKRTKTPKPTISQGAFRIAAIDVGSNSLHMVIGQQDTDGSVTTLWRQKEMVGLGRLSFPSRRLTAAAMDAAVASLRHFQQIAKRRECELVIAIATSAVREAENGGDFLDRIRRELGLTIRVVSAREEARLIYLGVRHECHLKNAPHLIVDIGGGSVEFIVGDQDQAMMLESRKLGAARMTAKFVHSDPINKKEIAALRQHFDQELAGTCEHIAELKPVKAIGTSGTLQSIAAMCADLQPGEQGIIKRATLDKLVDRLRGTTSKQRSKMPGLDDQRKDQIFAGVLLTQTLFEKLKLSEMQLCGAALREGILLDYLTRHTPELTIRRQVPDPRRRSVLDLARRCDWHETHSTHVTNLVLQLFDELRPLHELGKTERELIEYGGLLHDIGWHISRDGHHKHSMYLIQHGSLKGFSDDEIGTIANIARYHRKSKPTDDHEPFAELSEKGRQIVRVGAALLRIADGLDRSHASVVSGVKATIKKQKIVIAVKARADAELEIWGARRKMDLLSDVFDRSVSFEQLS